MNEVQLAFMEQYVAATTLKLEAHKLLLKKLMELSTDTPNGVLITIPKDIAEKIKDLIK